MVNGTFKDSVTPNHPVARAFSCKSKRPPSLFLFPKDLFPAHDDPTILASKALPRLMMFFCLRSFNLLILFVDDFTVWSVSFLLSGLCSNIIPSDRWFLTTHGFYMMKYLDFFQRPELYVCVHVSM